jgi:uncharacterized protein (DUF2147 family)
LSGTKVRAISRNKKDMSRAMARITPITLLLAVLTAGAAAAQATAQMPEQPDPSGVWTVANGNARIRVGPCGDLYWGVLDWVRNPRLDDKNPDPAKRTRPLIGMPILLAMKPVKQNEWKGEIYDAQQGKTYDARMSVAGPDELKITGCVLGVFCGGQIWQRSPADDTVASTPAGSAMASKPGAPGSGKTTGASKTGPAGKPGYATAARPGDPKGAASREVCPAEQPG